MNGNSHHQHHLPTSQRLKGKVAIITGGASGFGESTARLFTKHGAKVIIADVQDERGLSLCQEINLSTTFKSPKDDGISTTTTSTISYIHCDVTNDTDMKSLIDFAISEFGQLDIMFSNAGIPGNTDLTILGTDNENFKRVFDVNVYGAFLGAKHASRVMIPAKRGVILFTSSLASVTCGESPHAYTMSKHAVTGLMKNLCVELGQYGIRVNSVSPCAVATPLLSNAMGKDKRFVEEIICDSAVLKGVTPEAEDVAEAALYLASDEAKFISGLNLLVDGGYSTTNQAFSMAFCKKFMSSNGNGIA